MSSPRTGGPPSHRRGGCRSHCRPLNGDGVQARNGREKIRPFLQCLSDAIFDVDAGCDVDVNAIYSICGINETLIRAGSPFSDESQEWPRRLTQEERYSRDTLRPPTLNNVPYLRYTYTAQRIRASKDQSSPYWNHYSRQSVVCSDVRPIAVSTSEDDVRLSVGRPAGRSISRRSSG